MRITESRLRRIIRQVISESFDELGGGEGQYPEHYEYGGYKMPSKTEPVNTEPLTLTPDNAIRIKARKMLNNELDKGKDLETAFDIVSKEFGMNVNQLKYYLKR